MRFPDPPKNLPIICQVFHADFLKSWGQIVSHQLVDTALALASGGGRRPTFGECIERKSHEVKCPGGNYGEPPGQKRLPKSVSYISMFFHTRSQEGSPGARSGFSKGDLDSRSQRFLMLLSRSPAFGSASLANLRC